MKYVNVRTKAGREEVLSMLKDTERVNRNVKFSEKNGKPVMTLREKGERIGISCEYVGGESGKGSFMGGTRFSGKITEKNGYTEVKGFIMTDPVFHIALAVMCLVFIVMCIVRQGFNVVPVCLVVFDALMYKNEFKKQGVIKRYIERALRRLDNESNR